METISVREFLQSQIDNMRVMLDERYGTQTKALDAAFVAQQEAMQVALAAAEKAVIKAEIAADKRFELLNELRVGVATREQFDALEKQVSVLVSRVDTIAGQGVTADQWQRKRDTGVQQAVSGVFLVIGVISLVVTLVVAFRK